MKISCNGQVNDPYARGEYIDFLKRLSLQVTENSGIISVVYEGSDRALVQRLIDVFETFDEHSIKFENQEPMVFSLSRRGGDE